MILANELADLKGYRLFRDRVIFELVKLYSKNVKISDIYVLGPYKKNLTKEDLELLKECTFFDGFKYIECAETVNVADTAKFFFKLDYLSGNPFILSDISASVNIEKLISFGDTTAADVSFFAVPFAEIDIKKWSTCAIKNGNLVEISSTGLPSLNGFVYGVVGTFYFKKIPEIAQEKSIVDFISINLEALFINAKICSLAEIEIYKNKPDPSGFKGTVFCDLDGTLVLHEAIPKYSKPLILTEGAAEFLEELKENEYELVICTARSQADEEKIKKALLEANIYFSKLICGLSSGIRLLINDSKPKTVNSQMAKSFQITRNGGLNPVLKSLQRKNNESLVAKISGASGAQTFLLQDHDGNLKIRKEVLITNKDSLVAASKLAQQYSTMSTYAVAYKQLCPKPYELVQNDTQVSFCMDYVEPSSLHVLSADNIFDQAIEISRLLQNTIYNIRSKETNGHEWLIQFLNRKIYPKLEKQFFPIYTTKHNSSLYIDKVKILSLEFYLKELMNNEAFTRIVAPITLGLTHGDATVQNSIHANGKTILIDFEPEDTKQPLELDLGKLYQSALCGYEFWDDFETYWKEHSDNQGKHIELFSFKINKDGRKKFDKIWASILGEDIKTTQIKGKFYLITHLIRMIPYQAKVKRSRALYAYLLASKFLQELYEDFQQ